MGETRQRSRIAPGLASPQRCPSTTRAGKSAKSAAGLCYRKFSVGDSYDDALAESLNGLYKPEVIRTRGTGVSSASVVAAKVKRKALFMLRLIVAPLAQIGERISKAARARKRLA
jgi:hypothetical protein